MSLVAYAASSDEESDNEDETPAPNLAVAAPITKTIAQESTATAFPNGHISDDDDDDYVQQATTNAPLSSGLGFLNLPKPKNSLLDEKIVPALAKLPMPKAETQIIEEEDDEFLHKKATAPIELPKPPPPTTAAAPLSKSRVPAKITIPSMKDFSDVDAEIAKSGKKKLTTPTTSTKRSALLTILPQAKSEQNFAKTEKTEMKHATAASAPTTAIKFANSLVPDTVRNRRPAHNTEGVDGVASKSAAAATAAALKKASKKSAAKPALMHGSDSEGSDDEPGDFFSLNDDDEKLPEVNANELNVMVAKRAAKMAETTTKYLEQLTSKSGEASSSSEAAQHDEEALRLAQKRYHERELNDEALQALVGGSSKRRRQQRNDIEIVDISSNQVLPDREEWMRTALASQTTYQPTGVLVDEEPVAGTRRKHQITYLAHKAKANEAELQAMWSVNRQNRRATQSKYGF